MGFYIEPFMAKNLNGILYRTLGFLKQISRTIYAKRVQWVPFA